MIELLATCYLVAAATFAVPDGWQVVRVVASGAPPQGFHNLAIYCGERPCGYVGMTYVELRRSIRSGETADLPSGCSGQVIAK